MDENLFGQLLINFKLISDEQLERCLELQRTHGSPKRLGEILLEQGLIDRKQLAGILSVQKKRAESFRGKPPSEQALRERLERASLPEFLQVAREMGASDFYLTSNVRPLVRIHGVLVDLPTEARGLDACKQLIFPHLTAEQIEQYYRDKSVELSLELQGVGRFRASIFRHFHGLAAVFRVIADQVWPFEKLGLPPVVKEFTTFSRGLVLITGPASSGKSTTLASLIDHINRTQRLHIITIEDPIEVIFHSDRSFVSQRQVPTHTRSFASALRMALREDPDVIVVGDMRDPETVATAITGAETGHLIFGTMHTHNALRTVMRILDQYPAQKRAHIRTLLADVLKAVVSQQLVPNADGHGRSLAYEILINNPAIANLIREDRTWQIPVLMQTGGRQGMRLMDDSLLELVQRGRITLEEALPRVTDRARFLKSFKAPRTEAK